MDALIQLFDDGGGGVAIGDPVGASTPGGLLLVDALGDLAQIGVDTTGIFNFGVALGGSRVIQGEVIVDPLTAPSEIYAFNVISPTFTQDTTQTGAYNALSGHWVDFTVDGIGSFDSIYAGYSSAVYKGSGALTDGIYGHSTNPSIDNAAASMLHLIGYAPNPLLIDGTVTDIIQFWAFGANVSGGAATNAYGVKVEPAVLGGGAVQNVWGIKVEDQITGLNSNHAIQTGLGLNEFGDSVWITGNAALGAGLAVSSVSFFQDFVGISVGGSTGLTVSTNAVGQNMAEFTTSNIGAEQTGIALRDGGGVGVVFGLYNDGVNPTAGYFSADSGLYFFGDVATPTIYILDSTGHTGRVVVGGGLADDDGSTLLQVLGAQTLKGLLTKYNNVATAGWGVPAIYKADRATGQIAAKTLAAYTVGAADGSFEISANINVTTSTTFSIGATVSYTDETNTARVATLPFVGLAGTVLTTITNVLGAGPYEGVSLHIRCKAGTTITVATTGTFTSVAYNVEESIRQLA